MSHFGHAHAHGEAASLTSTIGNNDQMVNLQSYVDVDHSQVLNAEPSTNLRSILSSTPGVLRSDVDVDAQLLLVVQFRERVKLRGLRIDATEARYDGDAETAAPKTVKLFINRPNYSFGDCESEEATETLVLKTNQLDGSQEIKLKFVKFQSVSSLTIFVQDNQEDAAITFLNRLEFIGTIVAGMNVNEIKKMSEDE